MRSNYRALGEFIDPIKVKNTDLKAKELLGINIDKYFMPSVANVVGTDLSKYKVVKLGQFACNRMHVGRDYRIPIALSDRQDPFIISPAYDVFEITMPDELLDEYLMMWFSRPEFDRNAWFHTDADVRGGLPWEMFCSLELPIPSIEKQREIVAEYNTVVNRIKLNENLNQKLEETAQALYKNWFVDFEFPDENGNPYKSSGGKMIYNEELEKEIPEGWEVNSFDKVIGDFISKRGKSKSLMNLKEQSSEFKFPVISAMNIKNGKIVKRHTIPFIDQVDYEEWMNPPLNKDDVLLTSEAPLGETYYVANNSELAISQRLYCLRTKKDIVSGWYLYLWLRRPFVQKELEERSSGTTVAGIKLSELKKTAILVPKEEIELSFFSQSKFIGRAIEACNDENQVLSELKELLLSKMTQVEVEEKEILE